MDISDVGSPCAYEHTRGDACGSLMLEKRSNASTDDDVRVGLGGSLGLGLGVGLEGVDELLMTRGVVEDELFNGGGHGE